MTANELRILIAIIGAVVFALIWLFGKPRSPKQGRRTPIVREGDPERIEPTFGEGELPVEGEQAELEISFSATDTEPGEAPIRATAAEKTDPAARSRRRVCVRSSRSNASSRCSSPRAPAN